MDEITARSIRENCEFRILELQRQCNHPSFTELEGCLEPWNFPRKTVKICDVCEIEIYE